MHVIWIYIICVVGFAAVVAGFAYLNRLKISLFFDNCIWWAFYLVAPLVYLYKMCRYPDLGYQGIILVVPLGTGLGMLLITLPLLFGWFQWDDKYKDVLPVMADLHNKRALQLRYFWIGFGLVLFQIFLDYFVRF